MSVSILSTNTERESSFQPFQCSICQARFTRHENLKRHAALHSRSHKKASLSCDICHATFSRPDLRLRHLKRKHPEIEDSRPTKRRATAEVDSRRSRGKISPSNSPARSRHDSHIHHSGDEDESQHSLYGNCGGRHSPYQNTETTSLAEYTSSNTEQGESLALLAPITPQTLTNGSTNPSTNLDQSSLLLQSFLESNNGFTNQTPLTTATHASFDTALAGFDFDQWSPDGLLSIDLSKAQDGWLPSIIQVTRGCELFFTHCSSFLPFLHRATFDVDQVPKHLLLSLLCLGYQHGTDPGADI